MILKLKEEMLENLKNRNIEKAQSKYEKLNNLCKTKLGKEFESFLTEEHLEKLKKMLEKGDNDKDKQENPQK